MPKPARRNPKTATTTQPDGTHVWRDQLPKRVVHPRQVERPNSLVELVTAVRTAQAEQRRLRAVGAGHSYSDLPVAPDTLLDTYALDQPLDPHEVGLHGPRHPVWQHTDRRHLVRWEGGVVIRALIPKLRKRGLALLNMAAHDGMTLAGAVATSTHGTGVSLPTFDRQVRSLTLVGRDGVVTTLEPTLGITDPAAFAAWAARQPLQHRLLQDDTWFQAAVVGLGGMGVIYALTLEVTPDYWLSQKRTVRTWSKVRSSVADGTLPRSARHVTLTLNPYPHAEAGEPPEHSLLITRNDLATGPAEPGDGRRARPFLPQFALTVPTITRSVVVSTARKHPERLGNLFQGALNALADESYTARWHEVLPLARKSQQGYSTEVAVPLSRAAEAIDAILALTAQLAAEGMYMTAPFNLRFTGSSDALLSPAYGHDTLWVEVPLLLGSPFAEVIMGRFESMLMTLGGRPHWAKVHQRVGSERSVSELYPRYADWLAVYAWMNEHGTFSNPATERLGFDRDAAAATPSEPAWTVPA